jgi:hypothetical protein
MVSRYIAEEILKQRAATSDQINAWVGTFFASPEQYPKLLRDSTSPLRVNFNQIHLSSVGDVHLANENRFAVYIGGFIKTYPVRNSN